VRKEGESRWQYFRSFRWMEDNPMLGCLSIPAFIAIFLTLVFGIWRIYLAFSM